MLRLLAQREEAYEDIGALMGISVAEVRNRVRGALAELDSGAEAVPEPTPPPPPPPPPRAERRAEQAAPEPPPEPPRARAGSPPKERRGPGSSLLGNRRLLAEILGGALVVVLLVLFAIGAIDIGGGDSDSGSSETAPTAITPTSNSKKPTQAVLRGVDGSDAEGRAVFGRLRNQVLLVVAAKGLAPSPQGSSYAISLARTPSERIPIAATKVAKTGTISGQFQVPATALGLLASGFDEMEISLVSNGELRVAVTEAQKEKKTPQFSGTDVLRGKVTGPVVDAGGEGEG